MKITPRHEVNRREALKLLAGGIAALEVGCMARPGDEQIVPYLDDPEQHPGTPVCYASALALDGFGIGVIAETHEGRPTKLDGNPAHPASAGGSPPWLQARILDLYDPQRAKDTYVDGQLTSRDALVARLRALPPGELWLVMPPQSSPTIGQLLEVIRARHDVHVVWDAPLGRRNAYRGHAAVYGRALEAQPELSRAGVVVSLDSDFLACGPMSPAWARATAARRAPDRRMSRLWVCEPMPTPTGTLADEHLAVRAGDVAAVAVALVAELAVGVPIPRELVASAHARLGSLLPRVRALADDLAHHRGACAVLVGDRQPPVVHALARWIDHACGSPLTLTEPALIAPLGGASHAELAAALRAGRATAVIAIDCDPVYTAPHTLGLGELLPAAAFSVHAGLFRDHTAAACRARVPLAHELETWSDPRAYDGTLAIGQPVIRPRFDVASMIDLLAAIAGEPVGARALVREQSGLDEPSWQAALRAGVVAGTRAPAVTATPAWTGELARELTAALAAEPAGTLELALAPSPLHDGRFASNAWLQELPHPITKQTWGNAALMSPATAERLRVGDEDLVRIATPAGTIGLPAVIVAGAAPDSITIELGYGQRVPAIPIANEVGGDGYALRADDATLLRGVASRAGGARRVVRTQHEMTEQGHELAPVTTLAQFLGNPAFVAHLRGEQASLLPRRSREGVQWGMSIDTSICTGCSACMVACQAENNIPTVGPDDVSRGRHMNWIRIDRYIHDDGTTVNEPMPCQQCEHAPCEYVCPVMATTHSPDGLNEQVYNRCVGTRFCSNNCPYKVRRFNWFAYEQHDDRALQYNPDVTVRSRGVMEKCTYCVQRIRRAEHASLVEHRPIRTGEVVTACMAACPTGAIQFGELHEQGTAFAAMRRDPRRFEVLHDLGTVPRTQYLAKIKNPKEGT
ncbi:MAG: molybdopterin dinucleotide binding domain-containing protein [Acidobacteriota bacterium]